MEAEEVGRRRIRPWVEALEVVTGNTGVGEQPANQRRGLWVQEALVELVPLQPILMLETVL